MHNQRLRRFFPVISPDRLRVYTGRLLLAASLLLTLTVHAGESSISASNGWVRATPPGAVTGVAFLTLRNSSDQPAQLTGVQCATSVAARCEIHQHVHTAEGRMRMQKVDGLTLPPRSDLRFSPGSYHVMLLDLAKPLSKMADETHITDVELVFTFADQSTYHAHLPVKPVNEE